MIGVSQNQSMVKNSLFMTGKEKTGYLTLGVGGVFSCVPRELTGGVFCCIGGPAEWMFSFVPQGPMEGVFSCVPRELTGGVVCYVWGPAEWVFSDVLSPKVRVSWDKGPPAANVASTLPPN